MARLTKQDVVGKVAESTGLSKKDAGSALDAVISAVQDALAAGDSVGLIGFGTFEVKTRAAREGRNPQTGDPISIPEKKVPTFKPGKGLREAVA
ncbi:MAG: HU family DNA-binding protein [Candidatus Poribacteria bacterium]|nr:HU family DNA-binding protein [Candidatus Poribacteria bacterium]